MCAPKVGRFWDWTDISPRLHLGRAFGYDSAWKYWFSTQNNASVPSYTIYYNWKVTETIVVTIVTELGSVQRTVCKRLIRREAIRDVIGPAWARLISNIVEVYKNCRGEWSLVRNTLQTLSLKIKSMDRGLITYKLRWDITKWLLLSFATAAPYCQ